MVTTVQYEKRPEEVLDYTVDFTELLSDPVDTVASFNIDADDGITIGTTSETDGLVNLWVSGGTYPERYQVDVTVTTTQGRIKTHTFFILIREYVG